MPPPDSVPQYFDDAVVRITNDDGSFLLLIPRSHSFPVELVELSAAEAPDLFSNPGPTVPQPTSCSLCSHHSERPCPRLRSLSPTPSDTSDNSLPLLVTPVPSSPSLSDVMNFLARPDTPLPPYELPPSYSSVGLTSTSFVQLTPLTYSLNEVETACLEGYEYEMRQMDLYYKALGNSVWMPHTPFHTPYPRIRLSFLKHSADNFGFYRSEDLFYLRLLIGRNRYDSLLAVEHESKSWLDPLPMVDYRRFDLCMRYVFEETVTCVFGEEEYTFPCIIYVYVRDWNLTWNDFARHQLFGSIPDRYGEGGDGPFSVERFRLWSKQFIVEEVGEEQFRVMHRRGIKRRGMGLPVSEQRARLEEDLTDYWWKNRHLWKFSRDGFGGLARTLIPSLTRYWFLDQERRMDWVYEKRFPFWSHRPLNMRPGVPLRYNMFSSTPISYLPGRGPIFLRTPDTDYDYASFDNPFGIPLYRSD
ncbi:hypothetical protein K435DRAFT_863720 [Dendrothele bispora CBS 962.96]|uniref:Uncharacterized protein n=1 Tax=Dendrothele bispora (strain CBS 962.96) TaxID=1314807 RepID=A0A4V4HEH8_DENBC|nr:hypothetical protein K435DRAFT_863720 [Dendrothele bispora CBS 962.96]